MYSLVWSLLWAGTRPPAVSHADLQENPRPWFALIEKLCPDLSPHFQKFRAELRNSRKARPEKQRVKLDFHLSLEIILLIWSSSWNPSLEMAILLLSRFSRVRLCATPETAAHQAPPSLGFSRQEHWSGLPFPAPMHESEKWKWSCSVVSNSSRPHGLQPTRLLRPWDFPGKSTGVGCHCLLQKWQ